MIKVQWQPQLPPARVYKKENLTELLQTSQFLYQIGEYEWLRKKSQIVPTSDITSPEMRKKITYLKKCMIRFKQITNGKGRGIAAVQVGIPEQFFLLYDEAVQGKCRVFINPQITKKAETYYLYPEACMSGNSLVAPVIRPAWVEFYYYDEKGEKQYWQIKASTYTGKLMNRIVQHEIDHLDGIINIDTVQSKVLVFESGANEYEKAVFKKANILQKRS